MSTLRRIAKNTTLLLVAQVINLLLAIIYMMLAVRYLGPANYGIISFAIALTAIFSMLADFGLPTITTRDVSRNHALSAKYIYNIGLTKIIMSVITYGLLALFANIAGYSPDTISVVCVLGLYIFFFGLNQIFNAIFQAWERMEFQAVGQVLFAAVMLAGVVMVIQFNLTVTQYAALYVLANLCVSICNVVIIILMRDYWGLTAAGFTPKIDLDFCRKILTGSWALGILPIISQLYFRLDVLMLKAFKVDIDVGLYSAAHGLIEYCTIVPAILLTSMFPIMCQFYEKSPSSLDLAIAKSIKCLFILALPICMLVTLLADPVVVIIFGSKFTASAQILRILIWAVIFMYINWVITNTYVATNKQNLYVILLVTILALNFLLNLLLIPLFSYIGAAITKLITETLSPVIGMVILYKLGYRLNLKDMYLSPLLSIIGTGIVALFLCYLNVNIYIVAVTAVLIYTAAVYILGINNDDKLLVKSLFIRNKP